MARGMKSWAGALAGGMLLAAIASHAVAVDIAAAGPESGEPEEQQWAYTGPTGPSHWGEIGFPTCELGEKQSPIDIARTRSRGLADPVFSYATVTAAVTDTGHAVQAGPAPGSRPSTMTVDGKTYTFLQFHFHTPAEHQIGGLHYPAEMHFVHQAEDGSLAVVGVMMSGGGTESRAWEPFVDVVADVAHADDDTAATAVVDLAALLPKDRRSYRYSGSLTTPPCTEGVAWTVLTTPVVLSSAQLNELLEAYSGNNRPVQPLGERTVLFDRSRGR